jgi:hypothetical protein
LFARRLDSLGKLRDETVTNNEIQDVIVSLRQDEGITLSVGNPANFLKDYLRSKNRNAFWPAEIAAARYGARQAYGEGRVFDFVPYEPEQDVPFPDEFVLPEDSPVHDVETVSLPSVARALGRKDEAWLIQACVHQRVLQTHFALYSALEAADLFHLQNSLKGSPEIDAIFLLTFVLNGKLKKALITLEAKRNEPILGDQIREQVALVANQARTRKALSDIEFVLPVAANIAKRGPDRVVAVFEMAPFTVGDGQAAYTTKTAHQLPLTIARSVGYRFRPALIGI